MRLGIRTQLILALTALLVMAFVPLFIAVTGLTRTSMQHARERGARSLGRAVAAHVGEARSTRGDEHLNSLLRAEVGASGLSAIGIYDANGKLIAKQGRPEDAKYLAGHVPVRVERTRAIHGRQGRVMEVLVPGPKGPVAALLRIDDDASESSPLVRLVALYNGIFALALLVFTFMALTRLIVRPIVSLSEDTRRVADGAREMKTRPGGAREIAELAADVTQMTRALRAEEQALREKVRELEQTTEDLRNAQETLVRSERLASVGRLAAGLAHEIGNPISAILGLQDLLLEGDMPASERDDFVRRMNTETKRIHRVLRQLLDFARPAASVSNTEPQWCRPADAIEEACNLVRPQRSFQDIELNVSTPTSLPSVRVSQDHLVQVLINLLLNASDAMKGHGKIWIQASVDNRNVSLTVKDNGPGIGPTVRDTLFEPFVTTKDVGKGTGLGLAVCRGLVEDANGTLQLTEGEDGTGASFVVTLPVQNRDETEPS